MPKFGLATDNLLSARVVTADGRTTASERERTPLLGAARCGANFGVVSSFEYRLHEVGPTVVGGLVAHPFDAAADVLRFYRVHGGRSGRAHDVRRGGARAGRFRGEDRTVVACHVGAPEQAEEDLRPLREFGSPIMVELGRCPTR